MHSKDGDFVKLYATSNAGDIAFIKSILDEAEINYFIGNESVHQMYCPAFLMEVMVEKDRVSDAKELLRDFIGADGSSG